MENQLGKITKEKDGYQVVFERVLPHPIEKVWNAITNPDELKFWFTDIEMDFRVNGKITFRFNDADQSSSHGEIVSIDAPHRFVWTWEGELADWELNGLNENTTRLILTYSRINEDYAVKASAGFHDLLGLLADRLGGSENVSALGAEDQVSDRFKTPVHYAEAVYKTYPDLLKHEPVVVETEIAAPVELVWNALTDKDQMKKWYFNLDDFKPEKGFRFSFPGQGHQGAQYVHVCTITDVIPLQRLQYSWEYEGYSGYSLITFALTESDGKTRVKLTHHGLETFPQDNPDFAWNSFHAGWNEIIGKSLPDFLASPR